jgi:hypothetical protein
MPLGKSPEIAGPAPIDENAFRDLLARPAVAREMFLPFGRARWEGPRYTLGRGERQGVAPTISGVRVQEPDPNHVEMHREKGCQRDLVSVIRSVMELRKTPALGGVVLGSAKDVLVGSQAGESYSKRVLFGLYCPADGRFRSETEAAAECHRQIVAAGKRGEHHLRPEVPPYDAQTGFKGLLEWAELVRWQRRRRPPWWLLLLLLPLLFVPLMCYRVSYEIFNVKIKTDSVVIIIDKSDSMKKCFPRIRQEAERFLKEFKERNQDPYVDVIFFDEKATSVLKGIKKLNQENYDKIMDELYSIKVGNGTNLKSGLELAAKEIGEQPKKTTILVLTDGKQDSPNPSLADLQKDIERDKSEASVIKPLKLTQAELIPIPAYKTEGGPGRPPTDDERKWEKDVNGVAGAFNANAPGGPGGAGPNATPPAMSGKGGSADTAAGGKGNAGPNAKSPGGNGNGGAPPTGGKGNGSNNPAAPKPDGKKRVVD